MGMCGTMISDVYSADDQPAARSQLAASQAASSFFGPLNREAGNQEVFFEMNKNFGRHLVASLATTFLAGGMGRLVLSQLICAPLLFPLCRSSSHQFACEKRTRTSSRMCQSGKQQSKRSLQLQSLILNCFPIQNAVFLLEHWVCMSS